MDDVSGCDALGFDRNRSRDDSFGAVLCAQQRQMVDAVQERNDGADGFGLRESSQCRFQLRGFHRNPEHVGGRNLGGARNRHAEVSERAFETKLFRILREAIPA